jgi:hypothetical protein
MGNYPVELRGITGLAKTVTRQQYICWSKFTSEDLMTEKIKIGGIDYQLELVERLTDGENVQKLSGHVTYTIPKIRIDKELEPQVLFQTLCHEILHGISENFQIDIEEKDIDRFAQGIVQVIRDNLDVLNKYYVWKNQ